MRLRIRIRIEGSKYGFAEEVRRRGMAEGRTSTLERERAAASAVPAGMPVGRRTPRGKRRWYLVHAPQREQATCDKLKRLIPPELLEDAFVMRKDRVRKRHGQWVTYQVPMYRDYIFVVKRDVGALDAELGKLSFPARVCRGENRFFAPMAEEAQAWYERMMDATHTIRTSTAVIVCISLEAWQAIKAFCVLASLLYVITHIRSRRILNYSLLIAGMVLISTLIAYAAGGVYSNALFDGAMFAACIYVLYSIILIFAERGMFNYAMRTLFICVTIYDFCSLYFIVQLGGNSGYYLIRYFVGNKFTTSYVFIVLPALYFALAMGKGDVKITTLFIYLLLVALSFAVSLYIYYSTATVASFVLLLFPLMTKRLRAFLIKPHVIVAFMIISGAILYLLPNIVVNEFVVGVISRYFGADTTLTGRVQIYNAALLIVSASPIFGYGYGANPAIAYVGYDNAQNGLLKLSFITVSSAYCCFVCSHIPAQEGHTMAQEPNGNCNDRICDAGSFNSRSCILVYIAYCFRIAEWL